MKKILPIIFITFYSFSHLYAQQDLRLDTIYFKTKTDSLTHSYYSMIPWSQAKLDTIMFNGEVTNNGTMAITNVILSNQVVTPQITDTLYSVPINLNSNQTDTASITQSFTFSDSTGQYSWFFKNTSDSTDTLLTNNFKDTFTVMVTDTTFARDKQASGNFNNGPGSSFEIGVFYETLDTVKITSISISVGSNTLSGETISLYLYDENFQLLTSREFITYNGNDSLTPYTINEVLLPPGKYMATFKSYTDEVFYKKSNFTADSGIAFIDNNASGLWESVSFVTPIRLNVSDDLRLCDIKVDREYYGLYGCDSVIVTPYNGISPYQFLWENGDTTNYFSDLASWYGSVTVRITDSMGCQKTFEAGCYVGVNEQLNSQISFYPNPNTGNFIFSLENFNSGLYQMKITDLMGKSFFQQEISINGNYSETITLVNASSGLYFLEITNENGQQSIRKFIIK